MQMVSLYVISFFFVVFFCEGGDEVARLQTLG